MDLEPHPRKTLTHSFQRRTEYLKFKFKDETALRLGLVFDPRADGKTKLTASYGRFYEAIPSDLNQRAGSTEGFVRFTQAYTNASGLFQAPTTASLLDANHQFISASYYNRVGGGRSDIDPAIKPQSVEEVALGWEQELAPLWKFSAKWKYRYYKSVIEDFSFDFGNNYVIGNPGQRGLGTLPATVQDYDYPGQNEVLSFPKPVRDYRELVLSLDKAKGDDKWSLSAALTFATNYGNFAGLDSPLNGQADPNITSTYDLPTLTRNSYGALPNSPKYNLNVQGTYDLGYGFNLGGRFNYRAGTAISALGPDLGYLSTNTDADGNTLNYYSANGQYLHSGNYGNSEALLEPRGFRGTTPDVSRFDLHLEWNTIFTTFRKAKFTAYIDIYNVFNQQTVLTVNQNKQYQYLVTGAPTSSTGTQLGPDDGTKTGYVALDNPNFLAPTSFQAPRSLQLGIRLHF